MPPTVLVVPKSFRYAQAPQCGDSSLYARDPLSSDPDPLVVPGLEAGDGARCFLGWILEKIVGIDIGGADLVFLPHRQQEKGSGRNECRAKDKQIGGKGQGDAQQGGNGTDIAKKTYAVLNTM